jgi:membrane protease YdiL (CAAX protease family)
MPDDPNGPLQAALAFAVLLVGFLLFVMVAQELDVVAGLWLSEAFAIALPAFIWLRAGGVPLRAGLGLTRPEPRWLLLAVATGFLNQPIVALLEQMAHELAPAPWVAQFDQKNLFLTQIFASRAAVMTITVAVAAPLGEEIFFRGFALRAFGRRLPLGIALLLQGALFSLIHLDGVGFLGLWEIGIWLGVLRLAGGSLWVPILGHAVNNTIAAVSFQLGLQDPSEPPALWMLVAGTLLLPLFAWAGVRLLRRVAADRSAPRGQIRHGRALPLWGVWLLCVLPGLVRFVQSAVGRAGK